MSWGPQLESVGPPKVSPVELSSHPRGVSTRAAGRLDTTGGQLQALDPPPDAVAFVIYCMRVETHLKEKESKSPITNQNNGITSNIHPSSSDHMDQFPLRQAETFMLSFLNLSLIGVMTFLFAVPQEYETRRWATQFVNIWVRFILYY